MGELPGSDQNQSRKRIIFRSLPGSYFWTLTKTGDLVLIRRLLAGDWGEDFLVIEPGQESIMTYDEEIIGRRAVEGNGQQ